MRCGWMAPVAGGLTMMFTPAVHAQADSAAEGGKTLFEMFFLSDDWVGLTIIWLLLLASAASLGFMLKLFLQYR